MDFEMLSGPDGVDLKNIIQTGQNTVAVWSGPPLNAVLVQVSRAYDYDGNPTISTFVTKLVSDSDLEADINGVADKVLKGLYK
jgi:hypothetical protein